MTTPTTTPKAKAPLHLPFVIVAVLVGVGLGIHGTLLVLAAGQADAFGTFFLAALAVVTSFAALVYQLGKQAADIAQIATNTNGTLSTERQKVAVLEAQLVQAGLAPVTTGAAHPATPPTP